MPGTSCGAAGTAGVSIKTASPAISSAILLLTANLMNLHHPPTQSKSSFVPISSLAKGSFIDVAVGAFFLPLLASPQGVPRHSK
jgi:hypothetical protein